MKHDVSDQCIACRPRTGQNGSKCTTVQRSSNDGLGSCKGLFPIQLEPKVLVLFEMFYTQRTERKDGVILNER